MSGILLIDKPSGWTSNDVVCKMKGVFHERRIGHSGTLDPLATGLLPIFIGKATKAVEFAESHSKRYIAGISFGVITDTQDISGNIISERRCTVTKEEFSSAAKAFVGEKLQIPPMYSALKHNGKRLYDLARQGIEVERKARLVYISSIDIISESINGFLFSVSCSSGTYIRTLCHDIGEYIGCGACMSFLRRTECGVFNIDAAYSMDQINEYSDSERLDSLLLPVDIIFSDLKKYICTNEEENYIKTGRKIHTKLPTGQYAVYSASGEFLMLAEVEESILKSRKNFFEV